MSSISRCWRTLSGYHSIEASKFKTETMRGIALYEVHHMESPALNSPLLPMKKCQDSKVEYLVILQWNNQEIYASSQYRITWDLIPPELLCAWIYKYKGWMDLRLSVPDQQLSCDRLIAGFYGYLWTAEKPLLWDKITWEKSQKLQYHQKLEC